jgi:DHA2 family methylenomycin A resistance protein-like MFS transporter
VEAAPTRQARVLVVMCVGMFLVLLDVTVVNVALPAIGADLGAGPAALPWVVDAYAVAIASLVLGGGSVGDRVGHRRVVMTGLALFGLASTVCALAPAAGVLIAGRALQGVGAALLLPGSLAVITDAYPDRAAQARALGVWAGVSSLALPAGPLLGGALVTAGGWRLVFWINAPVVVLALVAVPLVVPPAAPRPERRVDGLGVLAAAVLLGATVFAVIEAGHHGPTPAAVVAAAVAVVALAALVLRERTAAAPMLPPDLLRRPGFVGPNLGALLMNLVVNGSLFVSTLYLQAVEHRSPLLAGVALLPLFVPLAALAPVTGRLTARLGPPPVMTAGAAVAAVGAAAFLLAAPGRGYPPLVPALLGLGLGAGLFTASSVAAALRAVPADRSGLASGVNNTARQTGTALGVAVFAAVAGPPDDPVAFTAGLHRLAVLGAALWVLAGLLALTTSPGVARPGRWSPPPRPAGRRVTRSGAGRPRRPRRAR